MIDGTLIIMMIPVPFSASIALRLRSVLSNDPTYKSATPLKFHKAKMPGTKKILTAKRERREETPGHRETLRLRG